MHQATNVPVEGCIWERANELVKQHWFLKFHRQIYIIFFAVGPPHDNRNECNLGGSVSPTRDPRTGRCICKEEATGDQCDQCKPNSFYMSEKNADGCLSCFCSGVTRDCDSSNYYRTQVRLCTL